MIVVKPGPEAVSESEWDEFFADSIRSESMLALKPTGTGPMLRLYRGVQLGGVDRAWISSWTANLMDASSFGSRVRSANIPWGDIVIAVIHEESLVVEYVVVGHPE